ncbi:MAG: glycoside hydrolase family 2, partial [Prevotellaceae bacterium]|nr:glycoside hydrolase family 2 [Prevotellaceae bacterium]
MKDFRKKNHVSRRTFIKSGMVLAAGLPAMRMYSFPTPSTGDSEAEDRLFTLFQQLPVTARPFVRWWWNGNKLTAPELLRELDVLKEAGIGGVEINPIEFPVADDLAIPSMPWLSPEWIEMVKVTLKGAEEREMICDIIVGSGWPFGAEFLKGDERSQLLTIASRKLSGAGTVRIETAELNKEAAPQISSRGQGDSEIQSVCLAPLQMDKFVQPQWLPFDPKQETLEIQVPEGEYILYAIVKVTGFQSVIRGTVGAGGPVLNHYDRNATLNFLNRMSNTLFAELKGMKSFRAIFCDSMELEGANWGPGYLDEFKRRRGYDIKPYLPFILYKVGGMGNAVKGAEITQLSGEAAEEVSRARYDFTITCMELIRERFLLTYTQWCNEHGFKSRVQAYGNEFHPLHASMDIDIPECETWTGHGATPNAYTPVNKFVASAARLSGKKIVSCEEITDTNTTFNTTLERLKTVCDQSNLSGVTHSIFHGFNYSPLTAPFPGWVRYGTFLNERNTWWQYFKQFTAYKTRLSALLQETDPYADIAVLHPLTDMWTLHGPQRDPFPKLMYPSYQYNVWEGIHRNGNGCDYTSEEIIVKSISENGFLKYGNRKYRTLILLEVETMMPATAKALSAFVGKGGRLIFVGKEPYKSPGLKDHRKNDRKVASTIASMKKA